MSLTLAATCSLYMENFVQLSGSRLYNNWNVLLYISESQIFALYNDYKALVSKNKKQ